MQEKKRNIISNFAICLCPYLTVALASVAIMAMIIDIRNVDIDIPLIWSHDALYFDAMIKSIIDSNMFFINDFLAAPYSSNFFDFPSMGYFDLYLIKFISMFMRDWAHVINFYYLITYPATATIGFYVLKKMEFNLIISGAISILYSILPYHFFRGQSHLNLSSYYFVPLAILVVYYIFERQDSAPFRFNKSTIKSLYPICIYSIFLALQVTYYIYFTLIFLIIAGIIMQFGFKKDGSLIIIITVVLSILLVTFVSMMPNLIYQFSHGSISILGRTAKDFNYYSLKLIQMIAPVAGHRVGLFSSINNLFINSLALPQNEDSSVSIGLIGSVGFFASLLFVFVRNNITKRNQFLILLSLVNIFLVLTATYGGIGNVAYLFLTAIRCYNRIIVYVAFLSLITVAYLLQELMLRYNKKISIVLIAVIFIGTCIDFASIYFVTKQNEYNQEYFEMKQYIEEIEKRSENQMIFQLPYTGGIPNMTPVGNIGFYEPYKPYLFSKDIKWSYGGTNERKGDIYNRVVSQMPAQQMISSLKKNGFTGILIDTFGYEKQNFDELMIDFKELISTSPMTSNNSRYVFVDITEVDPIDQRLYELDWGSGFSYFENDLSRNWRWGAGDATLNIMNFTDEEIALTFKATVEVPDLRRNKLIVNLDNQKNYEGTGQKQILNISLNIKPGMNTLNFQTNAHPFITPNDTRDMCFMLVNPSVENNI